MSIIDYNWDFSKEEFNLDLDFYNEKEQEDKLWQARTGLNEETLCGAIETIIFMNDRPVNLQKIKSLIDSDLPLRVVHESIARLQAEYEVKHHGIRLMEVAQGYQFRTKATYSKFVQNMFKVQSLQLSPTSIEVLSIIAYKQPLSKTSVETIRGVDSSHIIRALMDRRLVKMAGRSEEPGRPTVYATTTEFLEVFNLNSLDDLPSEIELEELSCANEVGKISEIKSIVNTGEKNKFDMDELLELDELSFSIQEISSETLFTKSLKDMDKTRKTEEGIEKKSAFDILEEYVNKAQVCEQNKVSMESEVLTSVMDPKSVTLATLNDMLLNAPEKGDEEEEFEIEVELEEDSLMSMSDSGPNSGFEELDSSEVAGIEAQVDSVLEKSEELIEAILAKPEESLEFQTDNLEDEIDMAFDNLIDDPETETETETTDTSSAMDFSSFISSKLAGTADQEEIITNDEVMDQAEIDLSEEEQLSDALDDAFANLMNGEQTVDQAKELDIDLNFLRESMTSSQDSSELEQ